jgi:hypothetical protein
MKALIFISEVTKNKSLKNVIDAIMDSINIAIPYPMLSASRCIFFRDVHPGNQRHEKSGTLKKGSCILQII